MAFFGDIRGLGLGVKAQGLGVILWRLVRCSGLLGLGRALEGVELRV